MALMHKDGVVENLHPLNLVDAHAAELTSVQRWRTPRH